uniref:Uncharacterized protein n=1 Tax=Bionectria ochroleuca TaxID=29856 RepID=A0A8H7NNE1_BIOOC
MPPPAKIKEAIALPGDETDKVTITAPDISIEDYERLFTRMPARTKQQRIDATEAEGRWEIQQFLSTLLPKCGIRQTITAYDSPMTNANNNPAVRLFNELTEHLVNQRVYNVVDYQNWRGLKTLRDLVGDVLAVARIHKRDSIVPAKRSIGWIYLVTCCHIRGKTDLITTNYRTIKLIEHLPTALYAAMDGLPDNKVILLKTRSTIIQPNNVVNLDDAQSDIKLEDIDHTVSRSGFPARELGLTVQTGLNFCHNVRQTSRPEDTVTIESTETFEREVVEDMYRRLFRKVMGVGIAQEPLRKEVEELTENEVKVLSADIKMKLWNYGHYHNVPHLMQWIDMHEDISELTAPVTVEHVPTERYTDMTKMAVSLYEWSKVDLTNHLCRKLSVMSKTATDVVAEWKKCADDDDSRRGCPMDAADVLMDARDIICKGAPNLVEQYDLVRC